MRLQNILEKKKIPFVFTLADNSLFYKEFNHYKDQDPLMMALYDEIDFGSLENHVEFLVRTHADRAALLEAVWQRVGYPELLARRFAREIMVIARRAIAPPKRYTAQRVQLRAQHGAPRPTWVYART